MAINLDSQGYLVISDLSDQEKLEIYNKTEANLKRAFETWSSDFGNDAERLETMDAEQSTIDEIRDQVYGADSSCVWTEMNYDTGSTLVPVEGLQLLLNGTAVIPGVQEDGENTVEAYWIGTRAVTQAQNSQTVYRYAQCICPFCGDDSDSATTCTIPDCDGNWSFEID